jgi:DNA-binding LacI/PurR family transcriptional regulator
MGRKTSGRAPTAASGEPGNIVSLADFARYLDLSAWTVSRAINGHPEVNPKTRDRILQAMDEIGFRPNPLARGLRGRRSGLVGISVAGLSSPILNTKIFHLQEFLRKNHLRGLLEFSIRDPQNEERVIEDFFRVRVDGIILIYSGFSAEAAKKMLSDTPCVQVDPHFPQKLPSVSLDRQFAMKLLLEHLLELGHRRFALLGIDRSDPWRWPALNEVAKSHGLNPDGIFYSLEGTHIAENAIPDGRAMAATAIRLPLAPTAFLCQDDLIALGAIQAIRDAGLRVPEDISVTGFDHLDIARHLDPPLTTIEQNPSALMDSACQLLLEQLADESRCGKKTIRTQTPQLIVGKSTGPAPKRTRR